MSQNFKNIPKDIILKLPQVSSIEKDQIHFLVSIPWNDKYFKIVPNDLLSFFKYILPYLHFRTTDVHTSISLSFIEGIIDKLNNVRINKRLVGVSLILHDTGWSKLSNEEIAQSLGIKGLKLNEKALGLKEKHAIEGEKISRKILERYKFDPPFTEEEKNLVCKAVLFHDKPEEITQNGGTPIEVKLVVDLDHLWSFSREGFWLDTFRKGITPKEYLNNLNRDLEEYFTTKEGREKARELLEDRKKEIEKLRLKSNN